MNIVKGGGDNSSVPVTPWFLATGFFDTAGAWWDIVAYPTQPWFLQNGYFDLLGIWDDSRSYP